MSSTDIAALPTPDHITLLFKHGKSTVLLSVLPDQPFDEIKSMLLAALSSRHITTLPGTVVPLPDNIEGLELGVLKDRKDATKGWTLLSPKEPEQADAKGGKRKSGDKELVRQDCPRGAGLADGSLITYRQKVAHEVDAADEEDNDDETVYDNDPGWNVVLPSYEEEEEMIEESRTA